MIKQKKTLYWFVVFNLLIALSACVNIEFRPSDFPYQLMLSASDLPIDWQNKAGGYPDVPNAVSAYVVYEYKTQEAGKVITHEMTIYQSEQAAQIGYAESVEKYFTSAFSIPQWFEFAPRSSQDLFRFECLALVVNGEAVESCSYLQRHGNVVIKLLANVDNVSLTSDQLTGILQSLDERIYSYQAP